MTDRLGAANAAPDSARLSAQWSWLSWALLGIVVVATLVIAAVDTGDVRSEGERAADLAATIRCPQCRGQESQLH